MGWIRSGALAAVNVSEGTKPQYRITSDAVEAFFDSRRVKAAPKIQPTIVSRTTKDYFATT